MTSKDVNLRSLTSVKCQLNQTISNSICAYNKIIIKDNLYTTQQQKSSLEDTENIEKFDSYKSANFTYISLLLRSLLM